MQAAISAHYGMLSQFSPMIRSTELSGDGPHSASTTKDQTPAKPHDGAFKVLIMEANVPLARLLATGLKAESLSVEVTHDLNSALENFNGAPSDLLILDLDMADMDGLGLLRNLRAQRPEVRILALSGRSGVEGMVTALDHGADDYLAKPFSLLELMARVRALRRRTPAAAPVSAQKVPGLVLHRDQCRVERDGRLIDLTPREFTLLEYLMQHSGKTISRAMLTQEVWNMPAEGSTNIVDVYIKYLRDKLDGDHEVKLIRTVRGMGYSYQAQAS